MEPRIGNNINRFRRDREFERLGQCHSGVTVVLSFGGWCIECGSACAATT